MSRRHAAEKRVITPDTKYNSVLLSKFINNIMKNGKKSLAEKLVYSALDRIEKKYKTDPFKVFTDCMDNVKPYIEVKSKRVGGANYQVPIIVQNDRGNVLAMRWIINAFRKRSGRSVIEKISEEIVEGSKNFGAAVKNKEETHKMAEANKAFAHFVQKT